MWSDLSICTAEFRCCVSVSVFLCYCCIIGSGNVSTTGAVASASDKKIKRKDRERGSRRRNCSYTPQRNKKTRAKSIKQCRGAEQDEPLKLDVMSRVLGVLCLLISFTSCSKASHLRITFL